MGDFLIIMQRIFPETLVLQLNKGLSPYYLLTGTDLLLLDEAKVQIIQAAREQGFDEKKIRQLNDLQDNRYDLSYTNEQVIVHEPKNFHAQNQYAQGSYLIVNESLDNVNKILEDAYEELYERI